MKCRCFEGAVVDRGGGEEAYQAVFQTSSWQKALPNPRAKHGYLGLLPDKFACWQLVFPQRPVPSPDPFPLPLLHFWHLHGIPHGVKSCFEQIHLQDFPVDVITDLSIYIISSQPVYLETDLELQDVCLETEIEE